MKTIGIMGIKTRMEKGLIFAVTIIAAAAFFSAYAFAGAAAGVKAVKPEIVCMVNDNIMGELQIPVEVGGKTYYGCCQGCVKALKSDRTVRFSKDPLTGREVDKAKAVIIEGPKGAALYFESVDTAKRYISRRSKAD